MAGRQVLAAKKGCGSKRSKRTSRSGSRSSTGRRSTSTNGRKQTGTGGKVSGNRRSTSVSSREASKAAARRTSESRSQVSKASNRKRNGNGSGDSSPGGDGSPPPKRARTDGIQIPKTDRKRYRYIQLPNGIRAVLISDPNIDSNPEWANKSHVADHTRFKTIGCCGCPWGMAEAPQFTGRPKFSKGDMMGMASSLKEESRAAVCLIVKAGFVDDPNDTQGLAHFTEHMIHYGSKKFPHEGNYWNFINNYGSHVGAYTQLHSTAYQFAINPDRLDEALEIFGNLIKEPRFDKKIAQDEVNAIDSEFHLRKSHEIMQVFEILLQVTSPDNHPLKTFCCGNLKSLKGDLKNKLVNFHKDHYVGYKMTFAIQSPGDLDHLERMVKKHLEGIRGKKEDVISDEVKDYKPTSKFCKLYKLKGDPTNFLIFWQFPAYAWQNFGSKPLVLLAAIMDDGRKGSIKRYLFSQGWVHGYDVFQNGEAFQNKYFSLFLISLSLTEKGMKEIDTVVSSIYSYIATIKKAPSAAKEILWNELKDVYQAKFDYSGSGSPSDNTHYACRKLVNCKAEKDLFTAEALFQDNYVANDFDDIIQQISPKESCYFQWVEQLKSPKYVPLSDTVYSVEDIPKGFFEKNEIKGFQFPGSNDLLPKRFSIQQYESEYKVQDINMQLEKKMMRGLTIPKAVVQIELISTEGDKSPIQRQMVNMLSTKIYTDMMEDIGLARKAGLDVIIASESKMGISRIIFFAIGFPEHIPTILQTFCNIMGNNATKSEVEFANWKYAAVIDYENSIGSTSALIGLLGQRVALPDYRNSIDTESRLPKLTAKDFDHFFEKFKSSMIVGASMEGNITTLQAKRMEKMIRGIKYQPLPAFVSLKSPFIFYIPPGEKAIRIRPKNPLYGEDENNIVRNIYQVANSEKESRRICGIVSHLMDGRVFQVLRTTEQLGYSLGSYGPLYDNPRTPVSFGIHILTPRGKFSSCHVNGRIDNFLSTFYDSFLSKMKESDYEDTLFKFPLKEGDEHISLADVQQWYRQYIYDGLPANNASKKFVGLRKLSLQVFSFDHTIKCICPLCTNSQWVDAKNGHLQITEGTSKDSEEYFISDIAACQDAFCR